MESGTCCSRSFSHFTLGKVQWLCVSCCGSGFCDLLQLFVSFAQLTIRPLTSCEPHSCRCSQASSQRPLLTARLPPCAARARHRIRAQETMDAAVSRSLQLSWKLAATHTRHRPSEADIARERKLLQLCVIHLCARFGISQDRIWNLDETAVRLVPKKQSQPMSSPRAP